MKALSIKQPWAWLILHGGKDIENRNWATKVRGPILIHASKGMTRGEYEDVKVFCGVSMPKFEDLERGGIVGQVEITGCVRESKSQWFFGEYGFTLENPKPLPFREYKGALGFFDVKEAPNG